MPVAPLDAILGKPLASHEEEGRKVGVGAGIPMLGLDALASSAYGPEAALTLLIPLGAAGIAAIGPIIGIILALLIVLYFSYRQTIAAYPNGGGSYTVARANLGDSPGLLAAAALLLDYILTVAVGISAGVGALVSAIPSLHPYMLPLCLGILLLITIVNLRGVRESGMAFALPTYLFLATLGATLLLGIVKTLLAGGHPAPVSAPPALPAATAAASLWLLLRSFASGCTAMTGVEAVSNGVGAFARPAVAHAQKTLTAIVALLGLLLAGIAFLVRIYGIGAIDPMAPGYDSVLSQLVAAVTGRGVFYFLTIGSTLAVLALSANTGFADFPRLCRLLAQDDYLPHAFANRGRRLVYSLGIGILAFFSGALLTVFGGVTDRLIPLFAVGAFGAFTLSQAGMVRHWLRERGRGWQVSLAINAFGASATAAALTVVLAAKFLEGAWITLLLIPLLLWSFRAVKRHYAFVTQDTHCAHPLDLSDLRPPLVVVPLKDWSEITQKALRFALILSPDIVAVHIATTVEEADALRADWERLIAAPARTQGHSEPRLVVLESPYRRLFSPLLSFVEQLVRENPSRQVAVIIPELVETRWWEYLLHNQRATGLKAALLLRGGPRVVVVNVPWYLGTSVCREEIP